MRVVTIPCLRDNFTYLVGLPGSASVAVVDPCEPDPVLRVIDAEGFELVTILNTHHHADHVGGNRRLLERFPEIPVYAHTSDRGRIPGQTVFLEHGDQVHAAGLDFTVAFVPGHTRGHIAYLTDGAAFVGDTLFGAGCGRLFEGTPEQMYTALNRELAKLPDATKLYFAHEYTEANLRFALDVEPANADVRARLERVRAARAEGKWTTPSVLAEERRTNPFLRVGLPSVRERFATELAGETDPVRVFAVVRAAKDRF